MGQGAAAAAPIQAGALVTCFGLMHGEDISRIQNPGVVVAYLIVAGVLFACHRFATVSAPAEERGSHGIEPRAREIRAGHGRVRARAARRRREKGPGTFFAAGRPSLVAYRDHTDLGSHFRLPSLERASPCAADRDNRLRDVAGAPRCTFCGVAVYDSTAASRGGLEAFLDAAGRGRRRLQVYRRADGILLAADCPLGVRRRRAQRLRAAGFGAALCVVAAMAAGLVPLSPVAQRPRHAAHLEEPSRDWPPSTSLPPIQPIVDPATAKPPVVPAPILPPPVTGPPLRRVSYAGAWVQPRSSVPDVDAVIGSQIHPGARRCYERARDAGRLTSARLSVVLHLRPSGEVDSATTESKEPLPDGFARCVASIARRAIFTVSGARSPIVRAMFDLVDDGF